MKTQFAILRFKKIKSLSSARKSEKHVLREEETGFNIDDDKREDNFDFFPSPLNVFYKKKLKETGKKERANGVKLVETVMTASPDFFKGKNFAEVEDWAFKSIKFMENLVGTGNIAGYSLHMDEKTPHIHLYFTPVFDGKFNCRALLGGAAKLSKIQDKYAAEMQDFGLKRGVKRFGSQRKHQPLRTYYTKIAAYLNFQKKSKPQLEFDLKLANELIEEAQEKISGIESHIVREKEESALNGLRSRFKKLSDDSGLEL